MKCRHCYQEVSPYGREAPSGLKKTVLIDDTGSDVCCGDILNDVDPGEQRHEVDMKCRHCHQQLYYDLEILVDMTGGDVCCGDVFNDAGINGQHEIEECTGGIDSVGRFGHDGDTCPIHESNRHPDAIMDDYDAGCQGTADIDMRGILWEIFEDLQSTLKSILESQPVHKDVTDQIMLGFQDWLVNNYGND